MKREYSDVQSFIDDVHEELNIKETLLDMGIFNKDDFKGQFVSCIFHDGDRTPSLQIGKNFWKCYACNLKGDIFAFLEHYYNIGFMESVIKLADFLNVNISSFKMKFNQKGEKLKQEWANYLNEMEKAPNEIKRLQKDYFPQEIGYDPKINYLVFPLTAKSGAILGFTKRRVGEEYENGSEVRRPKWKHSSLSDSLISQCHNVFNLCIATPEIRKKKFAILTEGPKDVIAYRRAKFDNVVCSCGTSNSGNIWDVIFPLDFLVLSMDGDKAGIEATIKIIINLAPIFDINKIYSVVLPNEKDPYDVIESDGPEKLVEYFDQRIFGMEFLLKYGDVYDAKLLFDALPEHSKLDFVKTACKMKGFSVSEMESWLNSVNEQTNTNKPNSMTEKEQLLALVNCEDIDVPYVPIDKAKRILALKYGIRL